jgi:hypothetical protein
VGSRYHGNHLARIGHGPRCMLECHGISLAGSRSCAVEGNTISDVAAGVDAVRIDGGGRYMIAGNLIQADSETLVDVRIHRNTMKALAGAAPPGAIPVRTGAAVQVYDNDAED